MKNLEIFSMLFDFLQTLTPEGFENCNKLVAYAIVIVMFVSFLKFVLSIFGKIFKVGR